MNVMNAKELPDLTHLKSRVKLYKQLPPQLSATDTSNWETRAFSAPSINIEREFLFKLDTLEEFIFDFPENPYLKQQRLRTKIISDEREKNKK